MAFQYMCGRCGELRPHPGKCPCQGSLTRHEELVGQLLHAHNADMFVTVTLDERCEMPVLIGPVDQVSSTWTFAIIARRHVPIAAIRSVAVVSDGHGGYPEDVDQPPARRRRRVGVVAPSHATLARRRGGRGSSRPPGARNPRADAKANSNAAAYVAQRTSEAQPAAAYTPRRLPPLLDVADLRPIIDAAKEAMHRSEPLDRAAVCAALSIDDFELRCRLDWLERYQLVEAGDSQVDVPFVSCAALEYLDRGGNVTDEALGFLPRALDNLMAREAVLHASGWVVADFRQAALDGRLVEHARDVARGRFAPEFVELVDEATALNFLAAATALMTRLAAGQPAGCAAEEIIAERLTVEALAWIAIEVEHERADSDSAKVASARVGEFFVPYEDEGSDYPDPYSTGNDDVASWFRPFPGIAPTGYLSGT